MKYVLHHNDVDGICSAFAVWMVLGESAKYIAVKYGQPLPELENPTWVYIVDFSYKKDVILELCERCEVVLIDHHVTAKNELCDVVHENLTKVIDTSHSGAFLTWKAMIGGEIPQVVLDVEDYDLWKFERPNTRHIHEYLNMVGFDMGVYAEIVHDYPRGYMNARRIGTYLYAAKMKQVEYIAKSGYTCVDDDGNTYMKVNSPVYMNEIAEHIYNNDSSIKYVDVYSTSEYKGQLYERHSLRCRQGFDVRTIAEKFGGGGHPTSSGYSVKMVVYKGV